PAAPSGRRWWYRRTPRRGPRAGGASYALHHRVYLVRAGVAELRLQLGHGVLVARLRADPAGVEGGGAEALRLEQRMVRARQAEEPEDAAEEDGEHRDQHARFEGDRDVRPEPVRRAASHVDRVRLAVQVPLQCVSPQGAENPSGERHDRNPAARQRQRLVDAVQWVGRVRVEPAHALIAQPAHRLDAGVRLGEFAENEALHGRAPSSSLNPPPSCSSWFSSFTSLVATAGMNLRKSRNKVPKKQMVPKSSEKSTQVG